VIARVPWITVCYWHIAKFFCNAKLGRYRGEADIEQASPRSIWLKPPTSSPGCSTLARLLIRSVGKTIGLVQLKGASFCNRC
jgi:hypothetical protein